MPAEHETAREAILASDCIRELLAARERACRRALAIKALLGEAGEGDLPAEFQDERAVALGLSMLPRAHLEQSVALLGALSLATGTASPEPADQLSAILRAGVGALAKMRARSITDIGRWVEVVDRERAFLVLCSKPVEARFTFHLSEDARAHLGLAS